MASQGAPLALCNLASLYLRGRGVDLDLPRAFALFQRAAELGSAAARHNLGLMYANGEGVARSYVEAWAWLDAASEDLPSSARLRDAIEKEMTDAEIAEARRLAGHRRNVSKDTNQ